MDKSTQVVHAKKVKLLEGNLPLIDPIYRSVKYTFPSIKDSISEMARELGFDYSRDKNPTTCQLEMICALLQEREAGVATSSGMAAIWAVLMANLSMGDRIIIFLESYAPTRKLVREKLSKLGINHSMISIYDEEAIKHEIERPDTKLVMYESLTNPMLCIPNYEMITNHARSNKVLTVMDNTFFGLHNLCELEVDYVVHSLTKFANGHGDAMGGIVLGNRTAMRDVRNYATSLGATPDPEGSYLILRGLKTYFMRYHKQCESSLKIAQYFNSYPKVKKVFYPGLKSSENHAYLPKNIDGFGAVITFQLDCDEETLWKFINNLKIFSTAASLGSVESLVAPVKLFFGKDFSKAELKQSGITDGTVRFAIGIEDCSDLIEDIRQSLSLLD
jgi:cystathionine beta-lyase/cystathionine gamma-synthase